MYNLDMSVGTGRQKVREEFQKNSHVRDPRVIDMLVIKVFYYSMHTPTLSLSLSSTAGENGAGGDFQHVQTKVTCYEIL